MLQEKPTKLVYLMPFPHLVDDAVDVPTEIVVRDLALEHAAVQRGEAAHFNGDALRRHVRLLDWQLLGVGEVHAVRQQAEVVRVIGARRLPRWCGHLPHMHHSAICESQQFIDYE